MLGRRFAGQTALSRLVGARACAASSGQQGSSIEIAPGPSPSLRTRFTQWAYQKFGHRLYPQDADICNCGVDLAIVLPQPELVQREGVERGTQAWRMQFYGAALYWHAATSPSEGKLGKHLDMLRGKDVLEVACMRGGGAHYLAEVAGPRSYVATDNVQEHIDICGKHSERPNLRFELADALNISQHFPAESFDFVLCIQAVASFSDIHRFVDEAVKVLRPGGRLIVCDALVRDKFKFILEAAEANNLRMDAMHDLSRAVHAVGLCQVPMGISYLHIVATKPMTPPAGRQPTDLAFMEQKAKDQDVVKLPSGLMYKVLQSGPASGPMPQATTPCDVTYAGQLINGKQFDAGTTSFAPNQVIAGWTEAMQLMHEGDEWELYIPANLAYGEKGAGDVIPPNSTLIFQMKINKVEQ